MILTVTALALLEEAGVLGRWSGTQRAQYPLIKEYGLNHNMNPLII